MEKHEKATTNMLQVGKYLWDVYCPASLAMLTVLEKYFSHYATLFSKYNTTIFMTTKFVLVRSFWSSENTYSFSEKI